MASSCGSRFGMCWSIHRQSARCRFPEHQVGAPSRECIFEGRKSCRVVWPWDPPGVPQNLTSPSFHNKWIHYIECPKSRYVNLRSNSGKRCLANIVGPNTAIAPKAMALSIRLINDTKSNKRYQMTVMINCVIKVFCASGNCILCGASYKHGIKCILMHHRTWDDSFEAHNTLAWVPSTGWNRQESVAYAYLIESVFCFSLNSSARQ